jgi:hypothetical protein
LVHPKRKRSRGDQEYLVRWEIDISASNPLDAAKIAQEIQSDSLGVFEVIEQGSKPYKYIVDLEDESVK